VAHRQSQSRIFDPSACAAENAHVHSSPFIIIHNLLCAFASVTVKTWTSPAPQPTAAGIPPDSQCAIAGDCLGTAEIGEDHRRGNLLNRIPACQEQNENISS
jgi:hypothetical protein